MFSILGKLFDSNEKEITKLSSIIARINALESSIEKIKDADFPTRTQQLKKRIADGEMLDVILPEAFALVRESAKRTLGMRHFDEQLMAGSVLSDGKIAEQKTGEGKTMSAVPALYLHSLTGRNVHLVTVNDYLARRDAGWMGPIFDFLGVSISSIINNDESFLFDPLHAEKNVSDPRLAHLKPILRKEAYKADIVYGINSEFGFDYLRDNRAQSLDEAVQRGFYFAVVDEVDSVLIDEARTPHILSAPDEVPTQKYYEYALLVEKLTPSTDYKIDEKLRTAHLSDHGISKIEKLYGVTNIYEKDFDTVYHLEAALKARTLFHREKDYIIKDNQVILIDEFTGRLMIGRRLSEGLHQALEAKEKVPIQRESKTLATVSLQNYFRMYEKLAGMTGTAVTEAEEFHKIYKLDVVVVPTHRKMVRTDLADAVYKTNRGKIGAIADLIEETHKTGQPILVGTTAIDKNEIISEVLRRRGIKHQVLNAKNHEKEATIIAGAGAKGAVTVATNMAGRGVDIILGGENPKNTDGSAKQNSKEWKEWKKEHDGVVRLGGLMVIGTERHESRRIDNQLRGRSGRQGDPGTSQFFVGLDDDIMRLFGGDTIASLMTKFNMPENVALQHGLVSRAIEQAQRKVEGFNFDIRKHLVEYDDVLNKQREIIYKERRRVLEATEKDETLKNDVIEKIKNAISSIVSLHGLESAESGSVNEGRVIEEFSTIIPFDDLSKQQLNAQLAQRIEMEEKIDFLTRLALDIYTKREEQLGIAMARQIERFVLLSVIDTFWMDHLDAIEHLRGGIQLRGYAQKDPLVEYKNEAYQMFERLMGSIDDDVVHRVYKIQVQSAPQTHIHTDSKTDSHKSHPRESAPKSVQIPDKKKLG
ncbi:MAG: preprotein translocase subunit SecA, partial [Patescibacteria group bacterium]